MGQSRKWNLSPYRTVRIPLRVVNQVYGADSLDVFGDDMVNRIVELEEYPQQFRIEFTFDNSSENPWFHAIVLNIYEMDQANFERFVETLNELKLEFEVD